MQYIVKVKDLEIPFELKNYKTSKTIKIYFKEDKLVVTKSPYVPKKEVEKFIMQNENKVYEHYKKIIENKDKKIEKIKTGDTILYSGEEYIIQLNYHERNTIKLDIDYENKIFNIIISRNVPKKEIEEDIRKLILKLFKNNTEAILQEKVPYWSKVMNITYKSFKVRDAKTKYGSCMPKTKELHFTSRLIMLKKEAIDAVIVHELSHIVYPNHSKDFYSLVEEYIPNYKELDKYLKEKSKQVINL